MHSRKMLTSYSNSRMKSPLVKDEPTVQHCKTEGHLTAYEICIYQGKQNQRVKTSPHDRPAGRLQQDKDIKEEWLQLQERRAPFRFDQVPIASCELKPIFTKKP